MKLIEDIKNYLLGDIPLPQNVFYYALWIGCFAVGWQAWGLLSDLF
ncbi:MAG: hypothetical protein ACI9WC_000371 [Arenicella sp.]|jgi:hypothetical protein